MDVADFKHTVRASFNANDKGAPAGDDFKNLLAIVKEYIDSNARSEVGI